MKRSFLFGIIAVVLSLGLIGGVLAYRARRDGTSLKDIHQEVLGEVTEIKYKLSGVTPTLSPSPTPEPSPTPIPFTLEIISAPHNLTEGDNATFSWNVNGPTKIIHSSTIYFGTKSDSSILTKQASPDDTSYTGVVKDFIKGDFTIPMSFTANQRFSNPATYYFRAYALIDGKNYWTGENSFVVKAIPKHEIKVVNYPSTVSPPGHPTFTWEITGPAAKTGFTTIVASKESKPGPLDASTAIDKTSYKVIVNDFTNNTTNIPLVFVGNAGALEPGTYYFRAFASINDKNIWSDEHSFKIE